MSLTKVNEDIKLHPGLLKVNFEKKCARIIVPSKDGSYSSKKKSNSHNNKINTSKKSHHSVPEEALESFSSRRMVHPNLTEGLEQLSRRIKSLLGTTKRIASTSISVRENNQC